MDRVALSWFPADCPHRTDCHCPCLDPIEGLGHGRVPSDTRMFQHIARFTHGHLGNNRYSYGRRLLGLRFTASPKLTDPLNLPAPGRRQSVYSVLRLSTLLCF
jgi:hypothetical protein